MSKQPRFLTLFLVIIPCLLMDLSAQTTPGLSLIGNSSAFPIGEQIATVGDLNNDGHPDIVLGIPGCNSAGSGSGCISVHSGFDGSMLFGVSGTHPWQQYGRQVVGLGDVNGDLVPDIAVSRKVPLLGPPAYGGPDRGAVSVLSGVDGSLIHDATGLTDFDKLGHALVNIGDVNGDGIDDILAGGNTTVVTPSGGTWALLRVFSGFDMTILLNISGSTAGTSALQTLASLGDVNGDGINDFAAGSPYDDGAVVDTGSVRVFSGANGALIRIHHGGVANERFGASVANAGDVNGDGVSDLIVGATHRDFNGSNSGLAYVFSGANGVLLRSFPGDGAQDKFGQIVGGAGDLNGDGFEDFLVAAPFANTASGIDAGLLRIFSGADYSVLLDQTGNSPSQLFGYAVAPGGDLNNDGLQDLVVGSPGYDTGSLIDTGRVDIIHPVPPAVRAFTSSFGVLTLSASWVPDNQDPLSLTGTIVCDGADPFANGLVGVSLAKTDSPSLFGIPILIGLETANVVQFGSFGFDGTGALMAPGISRQHPFLAGLELYLQFYESSPNIMGSNGLRMTVSL